MSDYLNALFRRRQNDGWFRAGRYDVTTVDLVCVLGVVTMFVYGIDRGTFNRLLFFPPLVRDFEIWRVVTWPIATRPTIWELLGIVFFWLFGQQLEALFGRNRFLGWLLAVTIVPALILTGVSVLDSGLDFTSLEFGLSTLFLGGIWVYAATYPGVRWFEVIPLWAIAAVFTLLNLLQYSGDRATGKILFLLLAVATALVAGRSLGLAHGWPIPHVRLAGAGGRPSGPRRSKSKPKRSRTGRDSSTGQRVVEGPWQRGPAPQPPKAVPSPADQAELDALLDKIGASGMDSLTAGEKRRLNELSKRLRG